MRQKVKDHAKAARLRMTSDFRDNTHPRLSRRVRIVNQSKNYKPDYAKSTNFHGELRR